MCTQVGTRQRYIEHYVLSEKEYTEPTNYSRATCRAVSGSGFLGTGSLGGEDILTVAGMEPGAHDRHAGWELASPKI